jgi:hypothetical protein
MAHDPRHAILRPDEQFNQSNGGNHMKLFFTVFSPHSVDTVHLALIVTHVLGALFSLVVAPLAMFTAKGGPAHRQWGRAYFWGMFLTNTTALVLLGWRFNIFLLGVTIISLYSALSGYRVLYRKRPTHGAGPTRFDWAAALVVLVAGVTLVAWGGLTALDITPLRIPSDGGAFSVFVILPIVFGALIANDALTDLRLFRRLSTDRHWWWYYHMERMLGSYIGLLTALMVQQVGPELPSSLQWLAWVAPSIIGTPTIAYWIGVYRRRFARQAANPVMAQVEESGQPLRTV